VFMNGMIVKYEVFRRELGGILVGGEAPRSNSGAIITGTISLDFFVILHSPRPLTSKNTPSRIF